MRPRWTNLNELDRAAYRATITFLVDRLEARATVDWALRLKPNDTIKRLALLELIDSPDGRKISEPWRSAWRLIEESWNNPEVDGHTSTGAYDAQHRLRAGDRSGSLITAIVKLVAPRLKIKPFLDPHLHYRKLPRRPKKVEDLFTIGLTSGEIVDPGVLELGGLTDRSFLLSLALGLDAAVVRGLDIARRIGHAYPEITELRAKRFGEREPQEQAALTARIRKRPPRNQWPKKADANKVKNDRLYWSVRELRRIEIAGALLPKRDKAWLDARIHKFPDLAQMTRLDEGFLGTPEARRVPPNPDTRYDLLEGEERLKALEASLSSARRGWDDDPAARAADWIRQPENSVQVLFDLESIPDGGAGFPRVWERFGWAHLPATGQGEDATQRDLTVESARVLSIIDKLPEATVRQAIDGISHWLSEWKRQVVVLPEGLSVWLRFWPIAVEATNAQQPVEEEIHLNTVAQSSDDHEPMDLDTLNTPAGELVGVFLAACSNDRPFDVDGAPRRMRDAIIAATRRSGLIARHRMIEALPYFLHAAPDWTREHLITPLIADNSEAIALWRAIARRTHFSDVLKIIGGPMAERATDRRLGRETRRSLVFSLVIECLHAFREQREPAVSYARIQQMIRLLDDEVRAYGAEAVQRFVHDISASREGGASLSVT